MSRYIIYFIAGMGHIFDFNGEITRERIQTWINLSSMRKDSQNLNKYFIHAIKNSKEKRDININDKTIR